LSLGPIDLVIRSFVRVDVEPILTVLNWYLNIVFDIVPSVVVLSHSDLLVWLNGVRILRPHFFDVLGKNILVS